MKFVLILCMGLLLADLAWAQRDPVCTRKPRVNGQCADNHTGYTYIADQGCEEHRALGCYIGGNFFHTRDECLAKCSPNWESRLQDFYSRSLNVLGGVATTLMRTLTQLI